MTRLAGGQPEDLLDAYVDGLLDDDERIAFEHELHRRPALRDDVARQERIDASLRRVFLPPSAERLRAMIERPDRAADDSPPRTLRLFGPGRRFALAASLVLAVAGLWMILSVVTPSTSGPGPYARQAHRTMQQVYADELASGFEPDWICEDDQEFESAFAMRFQQPLLLQPLPETMAASGLAYSNTISTDTIYLLASVRDEPVLVFVDKLERVETPPTLSDPALHVHRRVVGDLVLYEVSRLPEPTVIEYFFNPESESQTDGSRAGASEP
jgi:hypothetical protein